MNGIAFVDSNVLIYAHDRDAGPDSEDLNHGQMIAGVRVVNPLRQGPAGTTSVPSMSDRVPWERTCRCPSACRVRHLRSGGLLFRTPASRNRHA